MRWLAGWLAGWGGPCRDLGPAAQPHPLALACVRASAASPRDVTERARPPPSQVCVRGAAASGWQPLGAAGGGVRALERCRVSAAALPAGGVGAALRRARRGQHLAVRVARGAARAGLCWALHAVRRCATAQPARRAVCCGAGEAATLPPLPPCHPASPPPRPSCLAGTTSCRAASTCGTACSRRSGWAQRRTPASWTPRECRVHAAAGQGSVVVRLASRVGARCRCSASTSRSRVLHVGHMQRWAGHVRRPQPLASPAAASGFKRCPAGSDCLRRRCAQPTLPAAAFTRRLPPFERCARAGCWATAPPRCGSTWRPTQASWRSCLPPP